MSRSASMQVLNQAFANLNNAFNSYMANKHANDTLKFNKNKWEDELELKRSAKNRTQANKQRNIYNTIVKKYGLLSPDHLQTWINYFRYKSMKGTLTPQEQEEWNVLGPQADTLLAAANIAEERNRKKELADTAKNIALNGIKNNSSVDEMLQAMKIAAGGVAANGNAENIMNAATGGSTGGTAQRAKVYDSEALKRRWDQLNSQYEDFMRQRSAPSFMQEAPYKSYAPYGNVYGPILTEKQREWATLSPREQEYRTKEEQTREAYKPGTAAVINVFRRLFPATSGMDKRTPAQVYSPYYNWR